MRKILVFLVVVSVVLVNCEPGKKKPKCPERGETKHMNLRGCCDGMDDFFSSESEAKCKENMPKDWNTSGPKVGSRDRTKLDCFVECMFNESGYKSDGTFDVEKVPAVFQDAFEKCTNEVSAKPLASQPSKRKDKKCNRAASDVAVCVQRLVAINCPDNNWTNEETRCKSARMRYRSCPKTLVKPTTTTTTTTTEAPTTSSTTTTTTEAPAMITEVVPEMNKDSVSTSEGDETVEKESPSDEEKPPEGDTPSEMTEMETSSSMEPAEATSSTEASTTTTTEATTTTTTTTATSTSTTTEAPTTEATKPQRGKRRRGGRRHH